MTVRRPQSTSVDRHYTHAHRGQQHRLAAKAATAPAQETDRRAGHKDNLMSRMIEGVFHCRRVKRFFDIRKSWLNGLRRDR